LLPGPEILERRDLPSFLAPTVYSAPRYQDLNTVAGDFNNDGIADFAVMNAKLGVTSISTVSVYLGKGDGTFEAPRTFDAGVAAGYVVAGDFDGDGTLDLAVAIHSDSYGYGAVRVFLGNGDGTFRAGQNIPLDPVYNPKVMLVGDFNGDGNLDIVTGNYRNGTLQGGSVSVLLGNGDGTFQPPITTVLPTGGHPTLGGFAAGDIDGDGNLDLVVANGPNRVLFGNGDGTFRIGNPLDASGGDAGLAVADLNGDGNLDVVVASHGNPDQTMSIYLGNGDGTFQPPINYVVNRMVEGIAVADFNQDGNADLVTTNFTHGDVSVFLGNGDGTFQAPSSYSVGAGDWPPWTVTTGDFNGDGFPDILTANNQENVSLLLNAADWSGGDAQRGTAPTTSAVPDAPTRDLRIADIVFGSGFARIPTWTDGLSAGNARTAPDNSPVKVTWVDWQEVYPSAGGGQEGHRGKITFGHRVDSRGREQAVAPAELDGDIDAITGQVVVVADQDRRRE
jgi:hypothetical protein